MEAILHAVVNNSAASDLVCTLWSSLIHPSDLNKDALHVVPLLVGIADPIAGEILSLLAECRNAKEPVISTQESLEHLAHELDTEATVANVYIRLQRVLQLYIGG